MGWILANAATEMRTKPMNKLRLPPVAMALVLACACLALGAPEEGDTLQTPTGIEVARGDWPWWRGPMLDGHAAGPAPPVRFSAKENVLWKADVPGRGHASPCIWGDRIFISTAEGKEGSLASEKGQPIILPSGSGEVQTLLCFDRATGKRLWRTEVHRGRFAKRHLKNSHATPTPACDGTRVYVAYPHDEAVWLTAFDLDGKIFWQQKVSPLEGRYGYGSSPLLWRGLVILHVDHAGENTIKALDAKTGRVAWQQDRGTWYGFSSPIVAPLAGRDQLIVSGAKRVVSYDPKSGRELWTCEGPSNTMTATPVLGDGRVFASGGDPQTGVRCIRADGRGDVSGTHVAWQNTTKVYVPSPLLVEDRLVAVKDVGVAVCYDARSGRELWEERLGGDEFSASPTYCDGLVFVPNEEGRLFVFKPGKRFELVAQNELGDGGFASPVIGDGKLYLRTLHRLYCIGEK
jgi:outer membrane protein assembly factor BamB